ncbi:hypothetical protein HMN09_00611300 [Mycena chlorophos]|uniref:Mid2 domain-containing protein n=1 Tax=Mycena chlorophos TaxID=658473 RepID=A0A8H6T4F7_MYCCL|nr:hypothetical protein HMN09_00611300 [Mycena chlorophos]
MLVNILFFLVLLRLGSAAVSQNVPASDVDFSAGWQTISGVLQTSEFLGELSATLPQNSSSVSYFATQLTEDSIYGYSLDCIEDCELQIANVDGGSVDDATSPSAIFTVALDSSANHILRVYNLGTNGNPISFDHISVDLASQTGKWWYELSRAIVPEFKTLGPSTTAATPVAETVAASSTTPSSSPSLSISSGNSLSLAVSIPDPVSSGASTSTSTSNSDLPTPDPSNTSTGSGSSSSTPTSSGGASGDSNSASTSTGVSKKLVIGLTVFSVAVTVGILALLLFCLRRRQRERRTFGAPPSSPTGSIIPIMPPPPPMRVVSENPFEPVSMFPDPFAVPQFDAPSNSPMMQRRQRSDSGSTEPTIPLPDIPPTARSNWMEGRSASPTASGGRSNFWISRTPVKTQFAQV